MATPSFQGLRVLAFESRRRAEIASIIGAYGGVPISAPAMREVPLETNTAAIAFIHAFVGREFDVLVSLTGVGLRALVEIADSTIGRDGFVTALNAVKVVARGPKPLAVLRDLGVNPWVIAPSPNTWRELLAAVDAQGPDVLKGSRVAVQEYGTSPPSLLEGLASRGARVTRVPVYHYALPEDIGPLQNAVTAVVSDDIDIALFTTATQVAHLFQVAESMGLREAVRSHLPHLVIASIGPTTSEELREQEVQVDLEASQPKMGILVRDAAEHAPAILEAKRPRY